MTVSRRGKRGTPKMRRATRMGRVRVNAGIKGMAGAIGQPLKADWVWISNGAPHNDVRPANVADNISEYALQHGRYETHNSMFLSHDLELVEPIVVNKTVSVIDGWIDEGVFRHWEIYAIERVRDLWRVIRRPTHPHFGGYDPEDRQDGSDAERAKNLLRRCRNHVGLERWNIFENVVRWNEPTGIPGSRICSLRDEAIWSAQETIAAIAGDIKEIFG
jgi:hypothetical protein